MLLCFSLFSVLFGARYKCSPHGALLTKSLGCYVFMKSYWFCPKIMINKNLITVTLCKFIPLAVVLYFCNMSIRGLRRNLYVYGYLAGLYICIQCVYLGAFVDENTTTNTQVLELKVMWATRREMGIEPRSFTRADNDLKFWAIASAPIWEQ